MSLSKSFFDDHDLNAALEGKHQVGVFDLRDTFHEKAELAAADSDSQQQDAWELLRSICFLHFTPGSAHEPFGLTFHSSNEGSFIADALDDQSIEVLQNTVPDIRHPDLRARIADIVWVLNRGMMTHIIQ